MKKIFYALAIVAIPFLFASCEQTEHGAATITFDAGNIKDIKKGENFAITGTVRIDEVGARFDGVTARVLYNEGGQTIIRNIADSNDRNDNTFTTVTNFHYTFRFDQDHRLANYIGRENLRLEIVANVRNGDQSARELQINKIIIPDYTLLGDAEDFTWRRVGGAAATGLEEFGLAWTQNSADGFTIVRRDEAQKFVQLPANSWTTITTQEALAEAVDAAENMTDFRGVRSTANATHNFVLATRIDGKDIMIHITNSTVSVGDIGTTITITGQSKR